MLVAIDALEQLGGHTPLVAVACIALRPERAQTTLMRAFEERSAITFAAVVEGLVQIVAAEGGDVDAAELIQFCLFGALA